MHTITSMRLYLIVFTIVLFFPSLLESAAYTVRNTGDWSGTTTWQRNGSNTTIPPTITDNVTIGGNHTVTITAAAVCLTLTFANDANNSILTMNDGTTLTVNGNVIFNSPTGNNHNKTWNINAATATVNGNITLNEGTDDTRITRINITSGTLDVNGSISFANITSDTRTAINISGAGNIYIAGDLTSTGSYGTLAPGTSGTVTFDSTNAQTISLVGGMLFNNVVVNKPSGTATFSILSGPYFEAENATMSGAVFANDHPGYSGTGFADYLNLTGDYVEWTINTGNVVTTELIFRYALDTTNRTLELRVNGVVADDSLTFTRVGPEWTNYSVLHSNPVNLIAGANTIRLTAIGESGPNLDYLAVIPLNSAVIGNFSVLSGTAVIANSFMVYGNLTVNGTLDLSTFTMNGNSSGKILAIGATGTLLVGGTAGGVTGSNFPMGYNGTPNINTTSRVSYNGTASQTIANSITYGTLEMNNTAGVNLSNGNITASTLSVITGTMTTGANVMRVLSARTGNGLINGALRHVHAFITGTYYYFEGPNTYVRPTAMTTTPDSITITSYPNTNIPVGNPAYAIKRYYDIIQHGGSGLTSTLRLHYDTAERNGLTESLFTLWRYNGTAWEDK
ncbi:MAG: CBM35 domain-containing protein, partial [Bacteroidota bacterium]